ncbi:GAF domain containing protein [Tritrichomonas foetus]|uniref:GAF domain containing protein n=1 Tax=Tritrichomonas foetus TaxID=1144522 RepID=A0A1J4L657_9EUKA|nr:GAF domain containing protein [Tritrichomonas foetus]|eukprot:OHT17430.1 GAF domain containing protein [Tritrichomonas foetus]
MATTPNKRRKQRYYDELATKLPAFAANHATTSLSRRPVTVSIPKRGKIVSVHRKPPDVIKQVSTLQFDQDPPPFRPTTPMRRQIHVAPIYPQTAKRNRPKSNLLIDLNIKPVVPDIIRSNNTKQQAGTGRSTIRSTGRSTGRNGEAKESQIYLSTTRSTSRSLFIPNDSNTNSPITTSISSFSSAENFTGRSDADLDQIKKVELKEIGIDDDVNNNDDDDDDDFKMPYIPPLLIEAVTGPNLPPSPPPSLSPFTFADEVTQLTDADFDQFLEEDTLFVKSVIVGSRWNTETIYSFASQLGEEQFGIMTDIYFRQAMKIATIIHLINELLQLDDISQISQKLEKSLQEIFNVTTCVVWINIPSAKTYINYTRLMKYPHGVGIVGNVGADKREFMTPNPTMCSLYSEEQDLPFCEEAEVINCQPIVDPKSNVLYGVILLIDKYHKSGMTYSYWPQSEAFLMNFLTSHLYRVFKKFNSSNAFTSNMYKILGKFISRVHNISRLIPTIKASVTSMIKCENFTIFIKEKDKIITFKYNKSGLQLSNISLDKLGIVSRVFKTHEVINVPTANLDKDFNVSIDNTYKNGVLAVPMISNGNMIGAFAVRGKKHYPCFTTEDINNLTFLTAIATPTIVSSLAMRNRTTELRKALNAQNKLASLLQTAESFARETNLDHLLETIIETSKNLVDADRASLFVVDDSRTQLMTKVADGIKPLLMPINQGIVGSVAISGQLINIPDAYDDPRFNSSVDKQTGYRTRSLVTIPVHDQFGQIIAVMQLMNKKGYKPFSDNDVELCKAMCVFAGIALANSKVIEGALNSSNRIKAMMKTVKLLNSNDSLSSVLHTIMNTLRTLVQADRSALFTVDKQSSTLSATINVGEMASIVLTAGKGVVGFIADTGKSVNIPDAYKDERFHSGTDQATGYRTRSILGAPVKDKNGNILAVIEMINKDMATNGGVFTRDDEQLLNAFSSFVGFAYSKHKTRDSSQTVAIWLANLFTSESSTAFEPPKTLLLPLDKINTLELPAKKINELMKIGFSVFYHSGLCETFKIQNSKLSRFLLSVFELHKNSRIFTFERAVRSLQFVFYIIHNSEIDSFITPVEKFALLIAALCHNLNYTDEFEGTQMGVALSVLFRNRPPYEIYHCEQTISVLTNVDTNIIETLTLPQSEIFWHIVFDTVIATDISQHFEIINSTSCLVRPQKLFNKSVNLHRLALFKLILKSSDVSDSLRGFEDSKTFSHFSIDLQTTTLFTEIDEAKLNIGFNTIVTRPIVSLISDFLPSMSILLDSLNETINGWQEILNHSLVL